MTQIAFPFRIDGRGRTAEPNEEDHIRQMIEQLLFTVPGERVNRPNFGTGLRQLVFAPNSPELAAATQTLVQGALQQFLGDVIQVEQVKVVSEESKLRVTVQYIVLRNQQRREVQLESES